MKSHHKALMKAKNLEGLRKKKTSDVLNLVKGNEGKVDDKGKKPQRLFGAKNNDSEQD